MAPRLTINELLSEAQERLDRVLPADAPASVRDGALLVDIRSEVQRRADGVIPGALFRPRNVLEWRVDPDSGFGDPAVGGDVTRRLILVCNEGYASGLAASTLQDLGFEAATDLVGGFQAWRAAGLPVEPDPDGLDEASVSQHAPQNVLRDPAEIARFHDRCSDLMRTLLGALADRPDRPRTFPEIEDAMGWPRRRIASVLGGVARLRNREFGGRRPYHFHDERQSSSGRWEMWMDAEQAHAVSAARGLEISAGSDTFRA